MCVQSTFWTQAGSRRIVHLWNGLNTTADHGQQDVEAPCVKNRLHSWHSTELSKLQDFQGPLRARWYRMALERAGETVIIKVPPVEVHSAIVLE